MLKLTPAIRAALVDQLALLRAAAPAAAMGFDTDRLTPGGDATGALLRLCRSCLENGVEITPATAAAACRGGCAQIAARWPGKTIELRVPPYAVCQFSFGVGPQHTRGTPGNVVECSAETFLALATGLRDWSNAAVTAAGSQAARAQEVFPLLA